MFAATLAPVSTLIPTTPPKKSPKLDTAIVTEEGNNMQYLIRKGHLLLGLEEQRNLRLANSDKGVLNKNRWPSSDMNEKTS
jgi:hypothetical protein